MTVMVQMLCEGKDVVGGKWEMVLGRPVAVPCLMTRGTDLFFKNEKDDPISPDYVTIKQYEMYEGDDFIRCFVNEKMSPDGPIDREEYLRMASDYGWSRM